MKKTTRKNPRSEAVTLRTVADYVGLAPCSISAILNNSAAGRSIPEHTRDRVRRAVLRLNYQPNYSARSLRTKRTYTIALLATDIGHAPAARIVAGVETYLRRNGYCLLVTTYDASPDWVQNHFMSLRQRGVEGVVTLGTRVPLPAGFPHVFVDLAPWNLADAIPEFFQKKLDGLGQDCAQRLLRQIEGSSPRTSAEFFLPAHLPSLTPIAR
ncbi:MAG: hypothetical protein DMG81_18745 [Acidobacteria bacterium]|nr:MAG: hypothetical protein DMG81_18745 [Acidobacteriota bacterium]